MPIYGIYLFAGFNIDQNRSNIRCRYSGSVHGTLSQQGLLALTQQAEAPWVGAHTSFPAGHVIPLTAAAASPAEDGPEFELKAIEAETLSIRILAVEPL